MSLEEKVLLVMSEKREASAQEIALDIDVPVDRVVEILKGLKSIGLLTEVGSDKSDR